MSQVGGLMSVSYFCSILRLETDFGVTSHGPLGAQGSESGVGDPDIW